MGGRAEEEELRRAQPQDLQADALAPSSGRSIIAPSTSSISPSRRSVVASSRRTKARSRGASAAKPVWLRQRVVERLALVEAGLEHVERGVPGSEGIIHGRRYKPGWRSCHGPVCLGQQTNWEETSS